MVEEILLKLRLLPLLGMLLLAGLAAAAGQAPKPRALTTEPSFQVANITPDPSGSPRMLAMGQIGRYFIMRNASLVDMIAFAYGIHPGQVLVGAHQWAEHDRYYLVAVPETDTVPNTPQQRLMLQKLLKQRFKLALHSDQRVMPAFVMTVIQDGRKLTPTRHEGQNRASAIVPSKDGWVLSADNASTAVLAGFLQSEILDRPVVDKTGLTGPYDIALEFTPDNSQFNGHPPPARETADPAPSLFDAIRQQLGLKLSPEATEVHVYTVEKAEKPLEK